MLFNFCYFGQQWLSLHAAPDRTFGIFSAQRWSEGSPGGRRWNFQFRNESERRVLNLSKLTLVLVRSNQLVLLRFALLVSFLKPVFSLQQRCL